MKTTRILTSVSVMALTSAAGIGVAHANNVVFDISVAIPTVNEADSASVTIAGQYGVETNIDALNTGARFGIPADVTKVDDYKGGTGNNLLVDKNKAFATAYSNTATNSIDLFTADGKATLDAATSGILQVTDGATKSPLEADVIDASARISFTDIGTGSSATLTNNNFLATATGNLAFGQIAGDINPTLAGGELGTSTANVKGMDSDATALVSTLQLLEDVSSPAANVTSSRIGIQAISDGVDTKALVGVPLTVTGNNMIASITGNDATGIVAIDDDKAITLSGSAGVASYQNAKGDDPLASGAFANRIEVGNAGTTPTADLSGSTVTFADNSLASNATANDAANSVGIVTGVSLKGVATSAQQQNIASAPTTTATVTADLFIQNVQSADIGTYAANSSNMSVLVQDASGATVIVGDTTLGDDDDGIDQGNSFSATATGNNVSNVIDVDGGAAFDAVAGINSIQLSKADANIAENSVDLAAVELKVSVGTITSDGVVTKTAVTVDGNAFLGQAMGNSQSSALVIAGTTISGAGVLGASSVLVDRATPGDDAIEADFSVLSAQVLDANKVDGEASADANTVASIVVDLVDQAGKAASAVDDSNLSVSSNSIDSTAIGNLSTENSITIAAGSAFSGTLGVVNDQTVLNSALLSADVSSSGAALIDVDVAPASLTDSGISVDGNSVSSRTWGNLADATTNSFTVSGVTVGDGDTTSALLPTVGVDRSTGTVPISTLNGSFALLNDQSVEDLETAIALADLSSDLVNLDVGSAATTTWTNTDAKVDGNSALSMLTFNQANSTGKVTATSLNAASALVNVQSFVDRDNDGSAGSLDVNIDAVDVQMTATTKDTTISQSDLLVTANSLSALGRVNVATNKLDVTAQTQTITGVVSAGTETSVLLGNDTDARGEIMLVNDQYFDDLDDAEADIGGSKVLLDIGTGTGGLTATVAAVDGNALYAYLGGNDASNTVNVNVGNFDLSAASEAGAALNGPVATLASNQRSTDLTKAGDIDVSVLGNAITLDADDVKGAVSGATLSVDGNTQTARAVFNNVSNTLYATGGSFETPTISTPVAAVREVGVADDIKLDETGFVVASRQENGYDIATLTSSATISLTIDNAATIAGSTITVDGNAVTAETRANESSNLLQTNFTTNEAQGFVVNVQTSTVADPTLGATVGGGSISLTADGTALPVATKSSLSVSGNDVEALASANRANNTLLTDGTNVVGGSGAAPASVIDPTAAGTGDIQVTADLAVINSQGPSSTGSFATDAVSASVLGFTLSATLDTVNTGSLTIDNNVVKADALIHDATNQLGINALGIEGANVTNVGAAIVSGQIIALGSTVDSLAGASVTATINDVDDTGSVALSVGKNQVLATGAGGTVENTLVITPGATITGTATPAPSLGVTALSVDADFSILNAQFSEAGAINATIAGGVNITGVVGGGTTGLSGDSLSVDNNLVQSSATGFAARNIVSLSAGSSSDATGAVANRQYIENTPISAITNGPTIEANAADAVSSSLSVSNNDVTASAGANSAVNGLVTSATASLQGTDGASATLGTGISVAGAEYSVLNWQSTNTGTSVSALVTSGGTIGADALNGAIGVDTSSVSVDGNAVLAEAVANNATNELVLNTGTFAHPSAVVGSLQTNTGATVSASVSGMSVGIGLGGGNVAAESSNSSFSVSGNSIGAVAIGNSAVNRLTSGN